MPGRHCAVPFCGNNQLSLKKSGNKNITFHCFPVARDKESSTIQKEWIRRLQKPDGFKFKSACVCSNHFTKYDYEQDLQNELLGLPPRRKLKTTAVPRLNLGKIIDGKKTRARKKPVQVSSFEDPEVSTSDSNVEILRNLANENKLLGPPSRRKLKTTAVPKLNSRKIIDVKSTLKKTSPRKKSFQVSSPEDPEASTSDSNVEVLRNLSKAPPKRRRHPTTRDNQERIPHTDSQSLEQKYSHLLKKYKTLKRQSLQTLNKIEKLNKSIISYKRQHHIDKKIAENRISEKLLNRILTKNQIKLLSGSRSKVVWTRDEIAVAVTLRYYSKKCYLYLRDHLHYPLPALSSLRRWATKLDVSHERLDDDEVSGIESDDDEVNVDN